MNKLPVCSLVRITSNYWFGRIAIIARSATDGWDNWCWSSNDRIASMSGFRNDEIELIQKADNENEHHSND